MEGRGFLEGVHLNADVRGGVIRGISDLLDGKAQADKAGSQQRAADAASAAAFEILTGLDSKAAAVAPAITFKEKPSTLSKAALFKRGEVLAQVGVPNVDQVSFSYANGPDCYLRLMPAQNLARPPALTTLKEVAGSAPLLRPSGFNVSSPRISTAQSVTISPARTVAGRLHCARRRNSFRTASFGA
jgi:hypothetical protein